MKFPHFNVGEHLRVGCVISRNWCNHVTMNAGGFCCLFIKLSVNFKKRHSFIVFFNVNDEDN